MDAPIPPAERQEATPDSAWTASLRTWLGGPNLPYACLLIIAALSLISRIVLLWR